jgi:hypothetical protein
MCLRLFLTGRLKVQDFSLPYSLLGTAFVGQNNIVSIIGSTIRESDNASFFRTTQWIESH